MVVLGAIIVDGTSSTIHVGEHPEAIHASWAHGQNVFDQCCPVNARPPYEYGEELTSQHPGGVNCLFVDGSVHIISYTIQSNNTPPEPLGVWQRICIRNDGLPVDLSGL